MMTVCVEEHLVVTMNCMTRKFVFQAIEQATPCLPKEPMGVFTMSEPVLLPLVIGQMRLFVMIYACGRSVRVGKG
jgi:hypothetical protein